ncbi:uncharacterized protein JCM6883_001949 [Sporobolomyces salmoneus]|uniref:uncharacterized protein n=1 Tax=Sporobolomyces salmoneus TaxID=183962 RepID=UPI003179BC14
MRLPRNARTRSSSALQLILLLGLFLIPPIEAATTTNSPTTHEDLGFHNPTSAGGSWLTKWNNWWAGGEPLNVVISLHSDRRILDDFDTFLDYCASLRFSRQCFQWADGDSLQAANLGDGNEFVNQSTILRYNYDDPIFGTCSESLQGGNHFRIFHQNGTNADTGAWFLAVSKEHNLAKNHDIVPNGYDLGRDELIEIALNPNGTRSPISKTLYKATVREFSGPEFLGNVKTEEINHKVAIDGRIAVLTVEIVGEGDGKTASSSWFTSITLTTFLVFIGVVVFGISSLGLFLFIHYHHHRHVLIVTAPWEVEAGKGDGRGKEEFPLLDRQK